MKYLLVVFLFILGACLGSFLCCQARRLHLKAKKQKPLGNRSVCLSCHKKLKWYDNLPIISWLILGGKCRHCHKKIGLAEFLSELGTATAFAAISTTINLGQFSAWPTQASTIITFIFLVVIIFLAIYDGLYGELPTKFLILAIIMAGFTIIGHIPLTIDQIWKPFVSVLILGGLYLALYLVSKGKWVGDGDWLLATAIGLALYDPWLALIALFLANFTACLVMFPIVKSKKNHHIHFGPFLVVAYVATITFANFFLSMI